jgi:NAD-dependent SIR2 family protein deacetylase
MASNPVFIFGAGATKACGGPLTNEILPEAFLVQPAIEHEGFLALVDQFLVDRFHVPKSVAARKLDDYPPLPLLMGLLDTAIDKKHAFGSAWPVDQLTKVRDRLEYLIFALIKHQLEDGHGRGQPNHYADAFKKVYKGNEPNVISLNYDIIVDNTICGLTDDTFPNYGTDISTEIYQQVKKKGKLLKLHGSLNWLYCPGCQRLDLGVDKSGTGTCKVLDELYYRNPLESRYGSQGAPCTECGAQVRPVLITPTHLKDYRNPHISDVWYEAERMLRRADRVIIVGYSLPEDDVDVIYLLKRALEKVPASQITVVELDREKRGLREHPVGRRYRSLFGDELDWHPEGFAAWLESQ